MQLRHLKTFAAVASTLNFTRAADQVHLSQSSVTEQIQALEADLGVSLFDRSRRRLQLTAAGRRLLDYATDLLLLADEARSAVAVAAKANDGALMIGGVETLCAYWLPPLLAKFRADNPAVRLQVKTMTSAELRGGLRSGALDVSFGFGDSSLEPDLQRVTVAHEALAIIVPPDHRLARREVIGPSDLVDEPFLVTETGCVYRKMFDDAFPTSTTDRPLVAGEFGSIAVIRRLVEAGAGCAIVPRLAIPDAGGRVATLAWNHHIGRTRRSKTGEYELLNRVPR